MQTVESLTQLNKPIIAQLEHDDAADGMEVLDSSDGSAAEENKSGTNGTSTTALANGGVLRGASTTSAETDVEMGCGEGMGCILAHSMGLGKTLQVVSFVHTLTTHPAVRANFKKVVILAPKVREWGKRRRQ